MQLFRKPANDLAWSVVGACIAIYLISAIASMVEAPSETPIQFLFEPSVDTLIGMGMGGRLPLLQGEIWTLITSTYLHADIIHILFNCLCLLAFFPVISQQFGKAKGFVIYTIAGIAGSLLSAAWGEIYSLGASGGVLGLYGAMIAYGIRSEDPLRWQPVKAELLWAIINFAIGMSGAVNVSNAGHFGGLIGGLAAGLLVGPIRDGTKGFFQSRTAIGFTALIAISLVIGLSHAARATYLAIEDRPAYDAIVSKRRDAELDETIRQSPDATNLLLERGLRRYQAGDQNGALADITMVVDRDPSIENLNSKAATLYSLQRYDQAIDVYDDMLKVEPATRRRCFTGQELCAGSTIRRQQKAIIVN